MSVDLPAQQAETLVVRNAPTKVAVTDALVARLRLPAGFSVSVFARELVDPRMLQVAGDGTVYVSRWRSGDVLALRDGDGDGVADSRESIGRLAGAHGLELREPFLAVASATGVWVAAVSRGRVLGRPVQLIDDLPDGGQHENRVVRLGPDGLLYVSVGSSCNDCVEDNQRQRGALLRYSVLGRPVDVMAKGLRNTIGFDWHPVTGELWGGDNGSDFHGDEVPPDELNRLRAGSHYGWPFCYGERVVDRLTNDDPRLESLIPGSREPSGLPSADAFCARTEPSQLTFAAHAAPIALKFYRGRQFPGYQHDAFVTLHGSWNRRQPSGYRVVRVRFSNGQAVGVEDFITGFLSDDGGSYFGRPTGLAEGPDGSLYISDDANGVIYRVRYAG